MKKRLLPGDWVMLDLVKFNGLPKKNHAPSALLRRRIGRSMMEVVHGGIRIPHAD